MVEQVYSQEESLKASTEYFSGDDMASSTWLRKYAEKDPSGRYLEKTPDDMHRRMAREFGRIEQGYEVKRPEGVEEKLSAYGRSREPLTEEKIYGFFKNFDYIIPQGSVMAALGTKDNLSSLSNCVVLPEMYDSYGGIMYADQQLAQLFKRRCGVGTDLSPLRPADSPVLNSAKSTTGGASFMNRFSATTREVAQNGRRGALMLTMDVKHPDIESFSTTKQDLAKVTGANVSVRLGDEFMQAVVDDKMYTHQWPIDSDNPEFTREVKARDLWDTIIRCAHNTAEPGLIFWDKQHTYSTSSVYPNHRNISTNPCSEIAMGNDSCRLMVENLPSFVDNPFTPQAKFNYSKFAEVTYEAQRLMDNLVDLELEAVKRIMAKIDSDPEPEHIKRIERETWEQLYSSGKSARRTGLGFTGLGDTFAALGMKFDSDEAMSELEKIMQTKCRAEFESSIDMAIERGAFEDFNPEYENQSEFIQMMEKEFPDIYERMMEHGRRNISISTVAPCGTVSQMTQTTSSIEPPYLISYKRRRKVNPHDEGVNVVFVDEQGDSWEEFDVFHHGFKDWMNITGETEVEKSPYFGSTAPEIDWIKRVQLQSIVQRYTTHSISSTINLPNDVTPEKVGEIYLEAWRQGLKGITVYRDGSRDGVLISNETGGLASLVQNNVKAHPLLDIKPQSMKYRIKRNDAQDSLHIIITSDLYVDDDSGKAYFIPDEDFQMRTPLGAATSVSFAQSGMDRTEILRGPNPDYAEFISRLQSASSNEEEGFGARRIKSLEHAVGIAFEDFLVRNGVVGRDSETNKLANVVRKENLRKIKPHTEEYSSIISQANIAESSEEEIEISGNNGRVAKTDCPSCDSELVHEEGCVKCISCGSFNKCG